MCQQPVRTADLTLTHPNIQSSNIKLSFFAASHLSDQAFKIILVLIRFITGFPTQHEFQFLTSIWMSVSPSPTGKTIINGSSYFKAEIYNIEYYFL